MRTLLVRCVVCAGLALSSILTSGDAASAQSAKMDAILEGQRAAALCLDLMVSRQDGFEGLAAQGYTVTQKRRFTRYAKGTQVVMFGAPGITLTRWKNGSECSFTLRGIRRDDGNRIYRHVQERLIAAEFRPAGTQRGTARFQKGEMTLGLRGTSEGTSMAVKLFHLNK